MERRTSTRTWSRRYPPLAGSAVAVLMAVFVLPSALNVPLSNPTQTLECCSRTSRSLAPKLTPDSMDRGFHAIPARPSDDPRYPACFFEPGDYTCVKDAVAEFWDGQAQNEDGTAGCWRMVEDGVRHIAGDWPEGNIDVAARPDNVCNTFETTLYVM